MTPDQAVAACSAAGLVVLGAEVVGRQVMVTVAKVPQSASGLAGLTKRLGCSVTVSTGTGNVRLWFMADGEG